MFVVVSYDIPNDRKRTKLFNLLKGYGVHTQYSVFECDLRPEKIIEMQERIQRLVDPDEDHVRFYSLCIKDVRSIRRFGGAPPTVDKPFYLL